MEGAIIYLFAHDARNPCQPPSHRVRCPPECQAIVRSLTLPVYSLEPLLPEAGQVGVGTEE